MGLLIPVLKRVICFFKLVVFKTLIIFALKAQTERFVKKYFKKHFITFG